MCESEESDRFPDVSFLCDHSVTQIICYFDFLACHVLGCELHKKEKSYALLLLNSSLDPLWTREFVEQIIKLLEPFVLMPPHDLPMSSSASSSSLASSSSSSLLSWKKDVDSDESSPDLAQQYFSAWSTLVSWMVVRCGDSVTETLHCTLEWLSKLSTREVLSSIRIHSSFLVSDKRKSCFYR